MRLTYVVGAPASGKTTLVETAVGPLLAEHSKPFAWREHERATVLGARREHFSGTDTLSMGVSPRALAWLSDGTDVPWPVLAEGDRLAHLGFLAGVADAGVDVRLVWLDCPPAVIQTRRDDRSALIGKAQNETWLRGRETKVRRLVNAWPGPLVTLDATRPLDDLVAALLDVVG